MYRGGITLPSLFCPPLLVFWASEVSVLVIMKVAIVVAAKYFGQNFKNDWVEACHPNRQYVLFMVKTVNGGFKYRDIFNGI